MKISPLPRLGFLGVGWIGRHRLESLAKNGLAHIAAICDPNEENCLHIQAAAPHVVITGFEEMLRLPLDGLVIATPSAQHAKQACVALKAGLPVFCQKPLALNAGDTREVIGAARAADCLLGVDLSYRYLKGLSQVNDLLREGAIGKVYAVELVFHNAYGPDKPWYYDLSTAGGGCLMDLGTHLIDLMLRALNYPRVEKVHASLFSAGHPLVKRCKAEDYATAQLAFTGGMHANLTCSWHLQAGREADIRAVFFGTRGGLCVRNVNGSFYDFQIERYHGTGTELITPPSKDWWGAAIMDWARTLRVSRFYDPAVEDVISVAEILDAIYDAAALDAHFDAMAVTFNA